MWRAPIPMPHGALRIRIARITLSKLPAVRTIPMKDHVVDPFAARTLNGDDLIHYFVRPQVPRKPVQTASANLQPYAQPTCVESARWSGGLIFVRRARATTESGLTRSNSRRSDGKEISESCRGDQERAQRRACRRENSQRAGARNVRANRSSPQNAPARFL